MPKYDAKTLENQFQQAASTRIRRKEKGKKDYQNDAGYWDGGRCDWGGSHNLTEDCQTIARSFSGIDDLKLAEKQLKESTSKQEFDAIKSRLIRQAQRIEDGLQTKTGSASSMFGICCIWADFSDFIENKLKPLRSEVKRLKEQVNKSEYKFFTELKTLKLEETKIKQRMNENKQKAAKEKDPSKRALLLQLIEDDGKNLEENLKKQKAIPTSNLKFEPDKYVSDLISAMKKAIEGNQPGGGNHNPHNRRTPNNPSHSDDNSDSEDEPSNISFPGPGEIPDPNPIVPNQNNQQLLIFGAIALVVIYFLMSQKTNDNYDY